MKCLLTFNEVVVIVYGGECFAVLVVVKGKLFTNSASPFSFSVDIRGIFFDIPFSRSELEERSLTN